MRKTKELKHLRFDLPRKWLLQLRLALHGLKDLSKHYSNHWPTTRSLQCSDFLLSAENPEDLNGETIQRSAHNIITVAASMKYGL